MISWYKIPSSQGRGFSSKIAMLEFKFLKTCISTPRQPAKKWISSSSKVNILCAGTRQIK